jgi:hypothetical protein
MGTGGVLETAGATSELLVLGALAGKATALALGGDSGVTVGVAGELATSWPRQPMAATDHSNEVRNVVAPCFMEIASDEYD